MSVAAKSFVEAESGQPDVTLLLFAAARVAAGTGRTVIAARSVADALDVARQRFGREFGAILDGSRVWLNGAPAHLTDLLASGDEVAVLPPVSGGAGA
jgi:molybdopterin synthase sulfur carrier subunit